MNQRFLKTLYFPCMLAMLLAACSASAPIPDWQMNTHASAYKAVQAYLVGDSRVAALEWQRARREVSSTGNPLLLARVELLRCAAQTASLDVSPCTAFEVLRPDTSPPEIAYADYLAGHASAEQAALLPPAQRAAHADAAAIAHMDDPLARLIAASVAWRSGRATSETLDLAIATASTQGWRRPLLAWLLLGVSQAAQAGDTQREAALRRRITLIESGGQIQGHPAKPEQKAVATDQDGMQGANHSHSRSYGEDLQRRRAPESADDCDARGDAGCPQQ